MYQFVILFVIGVVNAQVLLQGTCDTKSTAINAERNLNWTKFDGDWFQLARISNQDESGQCAISTFSSTILEGKFTEGAVQTKYVDNRTQVWWNATVKPDGTEGALQLVYDDKTLNAIVITTDYDGYALLYSCLAFNDTFKNVWGWQLSRNNKYSEAQTTAMNAAIVQNADLKDAEWLKIGHTEEDCKTSAASIVTSSILLLSVALTSLFS